MSNLPDIRFKGFTDNWEQRKLGELSSLITKGTTPLDKSNMGTVNFVKIESIDNSSGEITITQKISFEEHEGYLRRSQLKENDILFSIAGTLGRVTSVKSSILPANTNQALAIIRLKSGCLKYVKTYLKGKAVADFIKKNPTIGAQPNLSLEQVSNLEIALPSEIEQEQIGSFFENLDNLITLHQRKCDETKKLKQYILQKMFPKKGEKVPKIRFQGFDGEWEQRNVGDITDYSKGNGYSKNDLTEVGTPIILYGRLYTRYQFVINEVDTFTIPKSDSVYSQGNEVIIPASGETAEDIARASAIEKSGILLGGDLNILYPFNFINSVFLALAISNGEPQRELTKKAQGKSIVHIHNSDIQGIAISFPTRAEQDQIVAVFRNIDNLITLHQRKCDELKEIKKYMLQNIFPKQEKG